MARLFLASLHARNLLKLWMGHNPIHPQHRFVMVSLVQALQQVPFVNADLSLSLFPIQPLLCQRNLDYAPMRHQQSAMLLRKVWI